jgi:hypothetical protein
MMASERMTLVEAVEYIRNDEAYVAALAELQEVREVLALFEEEWMTPHDYEHEIEFLPKDIACGQCDLNRRARQLAERLRAG